MTKTNETKICKHCKTEIDKKATKCPHCGGKNYVWTTGKKVFAVIVIVYMFILFNSIDSTPITDQTPVVVQKTQAEIDAWNKSPAGKLCAKHPSWKEEDCKSLVEGLVWIGMSYDMLVYKRGNPNSTNVSNYGGGNRYQYCWPERTPSCFYDDNNDKLMDSFN